MNDTHTKHNGAPRDLGTSARAALGWSAGFTLLRDLTQFATMLVLVRLLGPAEYGSMAMAQAIFALFGVVSFKMLVSHALQQRDPSTIDWQAHFTAGAVANSALFAVTLGLAGLLHLSDGYASVALPLAVQSAVFLLEICSGVRLTMLETMHDWGRHRSLLMVGTLLGSASAIVVALMGGGVLALAIQPILFLLPASIDLLLVARWKPNWSWSWARYQEAIRFGANRAAPSALLYGRKAIEQTLLSGAYTIAGLGVFSRSIGLATLGVGRFGDIVSLTLYPVLTRSERGSAQFRRHAGLVLQAVAWLTIPSATLLAIAAPDVVLLIYGQGWKDVIPLVPVASVATGLVGVTFATYNLLLANDQPTACFRLDVISATIGVALAICFVQSGAVIYLLALVVHGLLMLGLTLRNLRTTDGITGKSIADALFPPAVAAGIGMCAVALSIGAFTPDQLSVGRLCGVTGIFAATCVITLRFGFPRQLTTLLEVAPAGRFLRRLLWL